MAGCGDSNREKIVGSWQVKQADKIARRFESKEAKALPAQQVKPPIKVWENDLAENRMIVRFGDDGRLETQTRIGTIDSKKQGTWEFKSFDAGTNKLVVQCTMQSATTDVEILLVDQDTIEMVPPNMAGLTMKLQFERTNNR
jgi:hypothetical protein